MRKSATSGDGGEEGGGNVMIDTPRFNERLAQAIEREGRLKYIILTHKDDVADHER